MRLPGSLTTRGRTWTEVEADRESGQFAYRTTGRFGSGWLNARRCFAGSRRRCQAYWPPPVRSAREGTEAHGSRSLRGSAEFRPPIDVRRAPCRHALSGEGDSSIHLTQLQVSASLLRAGRPVEEVVGIVLDATRAAAGAAGAHWRWAREETAIRRMCSQTPDRRKQPAGFGSIICVAVIILIRQNQDLCLALSR